MSSGKPQLDTNDESRHLPRVVLSDRVKEYIIEAVLNGELKPGDRIVESSMARQLGVSQAPVREAIRDLVLLGFLETRPYKGTSVRSFTPDELWETYTVRAALESLAARLAATHLTEDDVAVLQNILDEMMKAARQQDRDTLVKLDNKFHETILRISRNKTLHQLWKALQFGTWSIVTYRKSSYDPAYLAARHEELLEALKTRDPEKAMRAMQHHIEDMGKPPEDMIVENG
ncbi:MAG: GntR family transcriptional regulator [Anaerolineales bacterium]|nr:GntR family transcriptional regulator [Anaerolineales bacterium]